MMKRSLQAVPAVHTVVKYDNLDNMFHEIAYQICKKQLMAEMHFKNTKYNHGGVFI